MKTRSLGFSNDDTHTKIANGHSTYDFLNFVHVARVAKIPL